MDLEKNQLDELLEKMKRENKVLKKLIEKILKKNDKPD